MLEKEVRKALIETKEVIEKRLIEEKIIKNRLSIIIEDVKSEEHFKQLSEDKQLKISVKFIQELSYLQSNGMVLEEGLGDIMKSLLGNSFGTLTQTIFEPMINSILSGLGMGDGFMKRFIISFLTSRPSEVVAAFNDCKKMTKLVTRSIVEALVMSLQKDKGFGGFGWDLIRNAIGTSLEETTFVSKIENGIESVICSLLGKYEDKAKNVLDTVKPAMATGK